MYYDISYDVAALVIAIVLFLIHAFFYSKEGANRIYQIFISILALSSAMSILTALCRNQIIPASDQVNTVVKTAYEITLLLVFYYVFRSIEESIHFENTIIRRINLGILCLGIGALILNIPFGYAFSFENGQLNKYALNEVRHYITVLFLFTTFYALINRRKNLAKVNFCVALVGLSLIFVPFVLQTLMPNILLVHIGLVAIAIVLCFALETPDYERLKLVLNQLEESREEEERSRLVFEKSNADKTEFLENMSHELRTPINAIMGFNKMIQLEDISKDIKEKTGQISVASNILLKTVEDILDYAQIETSKLNIRPEEYETIKLSFFNTEATDCYIDSSIPQRLYGDINRIRQVLDNIYHYGKENSKECKIFFELSNLGIGDDKVRLKFAYRIQGLSIPEDRINIIRAGSFDEDVLSLAIAKKIVGNMGSDLKIIPDDNKNTLFSFEIDQRIVDLKELGKLNEAWERYEKHQSSSGDEFEFIAPTARILAVDDVKLNLMVLGGLLKQYKVQLTTVNSGADAIKYMEENPVDLVFMDIMMPEMDGVETLYRIKNDPQVVSQNAVIIALTANVTLGAREEYLKEGFDGYMSKPVDLGKIGVALRHYLPNKIEVDWDEVMGVDSTGKVV